MNEESNTNDPVEITPVRLSKDFRGQEARFDFRPKPDQVNADRGRTDPKASSVQEPAPSFGSEKKEDSEESASVEKGNPLLEEEGEKSGQQSGSKNSTPPGSEELLA